MGENPGATRTPRVARSLDRRAGKRASDREPSPTPPRRRSTTATPSPRARAFQTGRGKTRDVEVPVAFHQSTCDIYSRSLRPSDVRGRQSSRNGWTNDTEEELDKKPDRTSFHARPLPSSLPARARGARGGGGARSRRAPRTPTGLRVTRGCFSSARGTRRARCPRRWRRARRRPWEWSSGAARTC